MIGRERIILEDNGMNKVEPNTGTGWMNVLMEWLNIKEVWIIGFLGMGQTN